MTPRERVLLALRLQQPDRVPFMDYFNVEVKRALLQTEDIDEAAFAKAVGMDGIYFTDYVAPVFCKTKTGEMIATRGELGTGTTDFLTEGAIRTEDDLRHMSFPDPRNEAFYEPAKRFVDRYGKSDLAVYATLRPLVLFNVFFSMPPLEFARALFRNRKLIDEMADRFVEWNVTVVRRLQEIGGIDFFLANCDMAHNSGPFVSPQVFREVFLPKMRTVAKAFRIPWAFHSDGDLNQVMEDLLTLEMNAVNPFEPPFMDLEHAKTTWGDRICLWGNIDVKALMLGTPAEVEEEVKIKIGQAAPGGGYICASSNSITSDCKPENVSAMIKAVSHYGRYPISGQA